MYRVACAKLFDFRWKASKRMPQMLPISQILTQAETLHAGIAAVVEVYPDLTIEDLFSVAHTELVELGWQPDAAHPDFAFLIGLVSLLRPVYAETGDRPLAEALKQIGF
jgi:hypothetical protein